MSRFLPGAGTVAAPFLGTRFIADGTDIIQVQVQKGSEAGTQQDAVTVAIDVLERLG